MSWGEGTPGIKRRKCYVDGLRERAIRRWADPEWAANTREKRREAQKTPSEATKAAISATLKAKQLKGKKSATFGRKATSEQKLRMVRAAQKRWSNPEYRELQSARHTGKKFSGELCEKLSTLARERQSSPEYQKAMSKKITEWWRERQNAHGR